MKREEESAGCGAATIMLGVTAFALCRNNLTVATIPLGDLRTGCVYMVGSSSLWGGQASIQELDEWQKRASVRETHQQTAHTLFTKWRHNTGRERVHTYLRVCVCVCVSRQLMLAFFMTHVQVKCELETHGWGDALDVKTKEESPNRRII